MAINLKQLPTSSEGYNYILVLVDICTVQISTNCTRFVFLRHLKQKDMSSVASALLNIFLDVGFPKIMQSDNGTEFVNQIISTICQSASIDSHLISSYHARANGNYG
jgi:IS30 family transposase